MSKDSTQVSTIDDEQPAAQAPKQAAAAAKKVKGANHDAALSGDKKTITIHVSDAEHGHEAVSLSINGYAYQIPRGEPVEVPVEVLHVLENAKVDKFETAKDGSEIKRTSNRFAFSVHG